MTVTAIRPSLTDGGEGGSCTPESARVTALRAMLEDPAEQEHWPEIQQAIDYLIRDTFVADLAA